MISDYVVSARRATVALALFAGVLVAGCGGGGGGGATTTPMSLTINWPDRGRAVTPPSSALSARITIRKVLASGANIEMVANRNNNNASHAETYTSLESGFAGTRTVDVRFFAEPSGQGALVGESSFSAEITGQGVIGTNVTVESKIAKVEVALGQSVFVGEQKTLIATAFDAHRDAVAIEPDAFKWAVASGADRLRFVNGKAEGLLQGAAGVTASVDQKTSTAINVQVKAADN